MASIVTTTISGQGDLDFDLIERTFMIDTFVTYKLRD